VDEQLISTTIMIKKGQRISISVIIGIIAVSLGHTAFGVELPNPVFTTNTHVKDLVQLNNRGVYFTDFFIAVQNQVSSSNATPEQKIAWDALKTGMWTSISNSKSICSTDGLLPTYKAGCDIDLSYAYEVCKLYPTIVAAQNPLGDKSITCDNPIIKQYLISTKHYNEGKINGLAWKYVMNQAIFSNPSSETGAEWSEYSNFNPLQ
jgi:hypothetical protein